MLNGISKIALISLICFYLYLPFSYYCMSSLMSFSLSPSQAWCPHLRERLTLLGANHRHSPEDLQKEGTIRSQICLQGRSAHVTLFLGIYVTIACHGCLGGLVSLCTLTVSSGHSIFMARVNEVGSASSRYCPPSGGCRCRNGGALSVWWE
jgi:hypothetical protein